MLTLNAASKDYCSTETFEAECSTGSVIVIKSARYGRMSLNRCTTVNFGYIGCGEIVTGILDQRCSAKQECSVGIPDSVLDSTSPCLRDLTRYLEVEYTSEQGKCSQWSESQFYLHYPSLINTQPWPFENVIVGKKLQNVTPFAFKMSEVNFKSVGVFRQGSCRSVMRANGFRCYSVYRPPSRSCLQSQRVKLPPPPAMVMWSSDRERTTASSPYVLTVPEGQRINLTLIDFSAYLRQTDSNSHVMTSPATDCVRYATVTEMPSTVNRDICASTRRISHIYESRSKTLEIRLEARNLPEQTKFIIKYEGFFGALKF